MLSISIAAIVLVVFFVVFFVVVLRYCLRNGRQDANASADRPIELMRKSPLGRWRY